MSGPLLGLLATEAVIVLIAVNAWILGIAGDRKRKEQDAPLRVAAGE